MPGNYLREKRKLKGISKKQVAEATKIRLSFIEAIEENSFEGLPTGVYLKGFIKNYARFIDIDDAIAASLAEAVAAGREVILKEEEIAEEPKIELKSENRNFVEGKEVIFEKTNEAENIEVKSSSENFHKEKDVFIEKRENPLNKEEVKIFNNPKEYKVKKVRFKWPEFLITMLLVIALGAGAYFWYFSNAQKKEDNSFESKKVTVENSASKNNQKNENTVNKKENKENSAQKINELVRISCKFNGPCWIKVIVDNQTMAYEGVPKTGSILSWEGKENIEIRIGEPENIEITYQGKSIGAVGVKGQPIDKKFTKKGIE